MCAFICFDGVICRNQLKIDHRHSTMTTLQIIMNKITATTNRININWLQHCMWQIGCKYIVHIPISNIIYS